MWLVRKLPGFRFRAAAARHNFAGRISRKGLRRAQPSGAKAQSWRLTRDGLPWRLTAFA